MTPSQDNFAQQLVDPLAHCGPLLSVSDLAPVWHVSINRAHRLARSGAFDMFKVHPAIGPKRYSKALIQKYLAGERVDESTTRRHFFGRKRISAAKAS